MSAKKRKRAMVRRKKRSADPIAEVIGRIETAGRSAVAGMLGELAAGFGLKLDPPLAGVPAPRQTPPPRRLINVTPRKP